MNPITMLTDDHKKVRALLAELEATTPRAKKTRTSLLDKIAMELEVHTALEEGLFYPALRKAAKGKEDKMYFDALEAHRAFEGLVLPDLRKTDTTSETFSGRAKILRELVEGHIKEEERDMFPKMRKLLSAAELADLGAQMALKKETLLSVERGEPLAAALATGHRVLEAIMPHASRKRGGNSHDRARTSARN